MAFLTNMSCIPPDAFQACGRVRHPDSDVVHLYTASCLGGAGNAKAVKSYAELTSEAKLRDARATEMEKLCYKLASRARLFSFNFHDEYLEACFRVCGYAVRVRGVTGQASAWEMAYPGEPMRPWVCFRGDESHIPEFEEALRGAVRRCIGQAVAEAATFVRTMGGGGIALVMHLRTAGGDEAALKDFGTVQGLNRMAFQGLGIEQLVLPADRLLMLGQAPFGSPGDVRRLLPPLGAAEERACFSAPKGAAVLTCEGLSEVTDAQPQDWGQEYARIVEEGFPDDKLDEEHLCELVLRHCKPGDIHRDHYDQQVARAVAKALWTTCLDGERESQVKAQFIDWVTEGGDSMTNTNDEAEELWRVAAELSGDDPGKPDLQLVREMADLLRYQEPALHSKFVGSLARSLTEGPAPEAQLPAFVTLEHKKVAPGRGAIGSRAELLGRYKYIATRAPLGMGKTEGDLATMRDSKPESALSVTTRRSVAQSMMVRYNGAELGISFYHYKDKAFDLDPAARRDVDHLICELESIGTLGRAYEQVYLDEIMTILLQMASDINRSRFKNVCKALKDICRSAKNVFLADALLTADAVSEFVKIVEGPGHNAKALFSVFEPLASAGRSAELHPKHGNFKADDLEAAIKGRLEAGETRLFVFTNIKKLVRDLVQAFKSQWSSCEHSGAPTRMH